MGLVELEVTEAVGVVVIDNPPANAMSGDVLLKLKETVDVLHGEQDVRAVVFASTGSTSFLSGADVNELPGLLDSPEDFAARTAQVAELFHAIASLPQPTVAAVQASAVGGGLEFMLVCDLAITCREAKFALPEVRLGLIPGAGGTQRLIRRIPEQVAREMLLLGTSLDAEAALVAGLVNRVVPAGDVLATAREVAQRLAAAPRPAVQAIKHLVTVSATGLEEGLDLERMAFVAVARTDDAVEGTRAFLERRKPTFRHR